MIRFIDEIVNNYKSIEENSLWKRGYLLAYINKRELDCRVDVFTQDGISFNTLSEADRDELVENYPLYRQVADYARVNRDLPQESITFNTKRKFDYWKKIQNVEHIETTFDIYKEIESSLCEVEFALRELIRKRKEIHALKEVGFIFKASSQDDLKELFEHYFGEDYRVLKDEKSYIGYKKTLAEISMRNFVCPPE